MMNGDQIEAFEWAKIALSGACATFCFLGAVYVVPQLSQNTFNGIWRTRLLVQITAFLLALSQLLPLQIWDGEYGAVKILPSNFNREILCKVFTIAALGVLQPYFLLLAGFLCSYALRDSWTGYSLQRFPMITAGLMTLPFAGGQILSAFWSSWLESTIDENENLGGLPFTTYSKVPCPGRPGIIQNDTVPPLVNAILNGTAMSPGVAPSAGSLQLPPAAVPLPPAPHCTSCKYTFFSVLVHVLLTFLFTVIIATYGRVLLQRCANKALRRRILTLCILLPLLQALQCASAGVTVVKDSPHTWAHEISKFVAVVCVLALIVAVTTLLVILPLQAAGHALRLVSKLGLESGLPPLEEDSQLLPAYRTHSTPGNSAPLLPENRAGAAVANEEHHPGLLNAATHREVVMQISAVETPSRVSRKSFTVIGTPLGLSSSDSTVDGIYPVTVDRRTQERAAVYAHVNGKSYSPSDSDRHREDDGS